MLAEVFAGMLVVRVGAGVVLVIVVVVVVAAPSFFLNIASLRSAKIRFFSRMRSWAAASSWD